MKIAGEAQAELIKVAAITIAIGLIGYFAYKGLRKAGAALADLPGHVIDAIVAAPGVVVDAVNNGIDNVTKPLQGKPNLQETDDGGYYDALGNRVY